MAGAVILVMSLTGVVLAFERQAIAFAERDLRARETQAQPLSPSKIVAAASAAAPGTPASSLVVRRDRLAPAAVAFGRERTLFVDRYSGAVLGEGARGLRRFFHVNEDLHRALALKAAGKKVTGAANLLFLFIVLSGLYLWIPRRRGRGSLRKVTLFRGGLRGRARDFNWHNVLGFWSFLPLVAIVFSGVVISYPWAGALVYRALGSEPPRPQGNEREGARRNQGGRESRERRDDASRLDRLWSSALTNAVGRTPEWQSISVRMPFPEKGPVTFAIDEGNGARPDKRSQLVLDPRSGRLVEHKTYAAQSAGQKARGWLRWIHTGEAGGLPGQIVAALASAAAVVLVWTGIALALRRLRRWRGAPESVISQQQLEEVEA